MNYQKIDPEELFALSEVPKMIKGAMAIKAYLNAKGRQNNNIGYVPKNNGECKNRTKNA